MDEKNVQDETTTYVYNVVHCYYECLKCGLAWQFNNDYGMKENKFLFCPYCGRFIKHVKEAD